MGIWWVLRIHSVPWFWLVLVSFRGFFAFRLFVGITFLVLFDGFPWFCCFTVFVGCSTRSKIDIAFLENTFWTDGGPKLRNYQVYYSNFGIR